MNLTVTDAVTICVLAIVASLTLVVLVDSFTGRHRHLDHDDVEECGATSGGLVRGSMTAVCAQPAGHRGVHRSPEGTTWSDHGSADD